jgi:hypothetical protein
MEITIMKRIYKLTCKYNYVEFEIDDNDYDLYLEEMMNENAMRFETGYPELQVLSKLEWISERVNEEYFILSQINIPERVEAEPKRRVVETKPEFKPASEDQIRYGKKLGIQGIEKMSFTEAWAMINEYKNKNS